MSVTTYQAQAPRVTPIHPTQLIIVQLHVRPAEAAGSTSPLRWASFVSIPMAWTPTRITKHASGMEANPSRRDTRGDWSRKIGFWASASSQVIPHLATFRPSTRSTSLHYILAENVGESVVNGCSDMVELGNESVLEPIDQCFRNENNNHRLRSVMPPEDSRLTDRMASTKLLPLTKFLGKNAKSDPAISIILRIAMTDSMRPS